jgi:hypothetical protein
MKVHSSDSGMERAVFTFVKGSPRSHRASGVKRILGLSSLGLILLLAGCASETLFQSSFNSNTVGAPPALNQATGTVNINAVAGNVLVVSPPPNASDNWVQIRRPVAQDEDLPAMQCNFSQFRGDGTYSLLAVLYIPSGSGLATLQFEPFGQAVTTYLSFLHLDFMQNNTVRINDDPTLVFGSFPRDQFFTVAVTLYISPSSCTAHIGLLGTGASGAMDVTVTPLSLARQFGAVRFWMGYPWTGSFDVTDILVTRQKP